MKMLQSLETFENVTQIHKMHVYIYVVDVNVLWNLSTMLLHDERTCPDRHGQRSTDTFERLCIPQ